MLPNATITSLEINRVVYILKYWIGSLEPNNGVLGSGKVVTLHNHTPVAQLLVEYK